MTSKKLTDALTILGIEDYGERIFNSHSGGEIYHIQQYLDLAEAFKDNPKCFRTWFEEVVKYAELNWKRPESVFQHISKILVEQIDNK